MRTIVFKVKMKHYEYGGDCRDPKDRRSVKNLATIKIRGCNDVFKAVLEYFKVNLDKTRLTTSTKRALRILKEFRKATKHWNGNVPPLLQTCIDMIHNHPIPERKIETSNYREKFLVQLDWG